MASMLAWTWAWNTATWKGMAAVHLFCERLSGGVHFRFSSTPAPAPACAPPKAPVIVGGRSTLLCNPQAHACRLGGPWDAGGVAAPSTSSNPTPSALLSCTTTTPGPRRTRVDAAIGAASCPPTTGGKVDVHYWYAMLPVPAFAASLTSLTLEFCQRRLAEHPDRTYEAGARSAASPPVASPFDVAPRFPIPSSLPWARFGWSRRAQAPPAIPHGRDTSSCIAWPPLNTTSTYLGGIITRGS
ncbi:hypothetical protein ACCO45_011052 [Purpureocillium lilacinum]|uniref:Uncharacterized protein n=1 Tax=Purpureocillium lilacinum TaxID=33203 RepID=A0ACC4DGR4_PURLI